MKNTFSGQWLVDTNLLVYALDADAQHHKDAARLCSRIAAKEFVPIVAQQNILEAVHVFVSGYRMRPGDVCRSLYGFIADLNIAVISPHFSTYRRFATMIEGKEQVIDVFDWYLAATMLDNRVSHIMTANVKDFISIPDIEVVNPLQ